MEIEKKLSAKLGMVFENGGSMKYSFIALLFCMSCLATSAQNELATNRNQPPTFRKEYANLDLNRLRANGIVPITVIDGDTVPMIMLGTFRKYEQRKFKSEKEKKKYHWYLKKVKKVYPYAHLAGQKLNDYSAEYELLEGREKRRFYKRIEKEIREEYEMELMDMTVTEGRILIKLIDRETSFTSYELVQELRGDLTAFFWQGLARIFGHDLKSEFDGAGEDAYIEEIVVGIEMGDIPL